MKTYRNGLYVRYKKLGFKELKIGKTYSIEEIDKNGYGFCGKKIL